MVDGLECARGGRFRRFLYLYQMVLGAHDSGVDHSFRCLGAPRCSRRLGFAAPMARLVVALRHDSFSRVERGDFLYIRPLPFPSRAVADTLCWSGNGGTGQSVPKSRAVVTYRFSAFNRERADRELAVIWDSRSGSRRV